MCFSREEVFLHSRARHQFFHELKVGAKKDGTLLAVENKCYLDGGAYSSFGIATVYYAGSLLSAPYKLANMKFDGYRVYTNKPAAGAQRGHGGVVARACLEQLIDVIAEEIGRDPIDLRMKNIMEKDDVTCNYFNMSSLGGRECLEAVRDGSGWKNKKGKLPRGKGIGMAAAFYVSGAGYSIYRSETYHATAMVKLSEDGGTVDLYTASAEIGQGSDTIFSMMVAEALGVKYEDVKIQSGDTDFGIDLGAYSSRQTLMTGHAVKRAAEDLKRQVLEVLSAEVNIPTTDMDIKDGYILFNKAKPDFSQIRLKYIKEHRGWVDQPAGDRLTFREAARITYLKKGVVVGGGTYKPDELGGTFKGAAVGTSPAYSCSAVVAEVTVDEETGQVTVDKLTDAHDCGFAINRTNVEGQMQGSVYMGLGETLFEEVKFDEKGKLLNPTFGEYRIPTTLDMPNVDAIIVESDEPNGPFGAKEVGEGAILPTIPAIVNAIYDAIGVRINELPITAERVFMALKEKNAKKKE
jgi:4-hydroxybenzoyl-CoA reductase subunit alpha